MQQIEDDFNARKTVSVLPNMHVEICLEIYVYTYCLKIIKISECQVRNYTT